MGDQPADIGKQITDMVLDYVQRPNCIMLAVTAANTDLANSDAIAIAHQARSAPPVPRGEGSEGEEAPGAILRGKPRRAGPQVDPEGSRTLGVLTKLDLMDKGTDASEILTGRSRPYLPTYLLTRS